MSLPAVLLATIGLLLTVTNIVCTANGLTRMAYRQDDAGEKDLLLEHRDNLVLEVVCLSIVMFVLGMEFALLSGGK